MKPHIASCAAAIAVAAAIGGAALWRAPASPEAVGIAPSGRVLPADDPTTRDGLTRTIAVMGTRVSSNAHDDRAAVALADALLRQARVTGDATLPRRAEEVLRRSIAATDSYLARRMLGAVYLAQHRFAEALRAGSQTEALRPDDPWNYGIVGDAAVELGRYDEAFAAFDRMAALKPSAAVYARVAYARELQGDVRGALGAMQMAVEATGPRDPEGLSWATSQAALLQIQLGDLDAAARGFDRALFAFPEHPYALNGRARVAVARGDLDGALGIYRALHRRAPTPELAASIGDILARQGDAAAARTMWAEAERIEREGWAHEAPQPAALARLLAERALKPEIAVNLALEASKSRDDIFTNDALAWSLYRAGRFEEAWAASVRSRRTGTKDARILYHAAAIAEARGDVAEARTLGAASLEAHSVADLVTGPAVRALVARTQG